jgi:flagellar FliJ protein
MYHFNFEPLLHHRKFIEDVKQKDFALVQRELNQEQKRLNDLKEKRIQLTHEIKTYQIPDIQSHELSIYRAYSARLNKEIEIQKKMVEKVKKKVDIARIELLSAIKDRKILEKLKEKKKEEFLLEKAKREQKLTNEVAIAQYNRKSQ